jgi:uncharacterized protein (TIGR02757 family)
LCALFSYGNVKAILKFLKSLNFDLLNCDETLIRTELTSHYYRFQNSQDVIQVFITLAKLRRENITIKSLFLSGHNKENNLLEGLEVLIQKLYDINPYRSRGYQFLLGKAPTPLKPKGASALKRWLMFLRWMVRSGAPDLGRWKEVNTAHLLMPLDTHTFNVAHTLNLLTRKQADLAAVIELSQTLSKYDKSDPIKYDFALYRLGQSSENIISPK